MAFGHGAFEEEWRVEPSGMGLVSSIKRPGELVTPSYMWRSEEWVRNRQSATWKKVFTRPWPGWHPDLGFQPLEQWEINVPFLLIFFFSFLFLSFFFYGHTCGTWKFLGQGSNPRLCSDQVAAVGVLTGCATEGTPKRNKFLLFISHSVSTQFFSTKWKTVFLFVCLFVCFNGTNF